MMKIYSFLILMFTSFVLFSQENNFLEQAKGHLKENMDQWNLKATDLADVGVSSSYVTKHNGVTNYYLVQNYNGIEIYNAIANVHITRDGKVFYAKSRFVTDLQSKVETFSPSVAPAQAVKRVAGELGYASFSPELLSANRSANSYIFNKKEAALEDISAKLKYFLTEDDRLRLVWDVTFDAATGSDYASVRVDAVSGEVVDRSSFTVSCQFESGMYHHHSDLCMTDRGVEVKQPLSFGAIRMESATSVNADSPQYTVFPFPAESPAHGERDIASDDFFPTASPFGWHDTNGQPGPEHTITRGNNVWAWPARGGNLSSNGTEPNGGPELIFDYEFDPTLEPNTYIDAATVNLFYSNNAIHDFTYAHGFDEVSGNFQANNYGNDGRAGDHVNALAQFGAEGGMNINNADFATPGDGSSGRMRMFVWNSRDQSLLAVLEPEGIARRYATGTADFGPVVNENPITGSIAIARDGTGNPTLACNSITNTEDVAGKIAMVDRGSCFFIEKTANVQQAGAIACIICNFENSVINMGPGGNTPNPDIPTVMLSSSDCSLIRQSLLVGDDVVVSFVNETVGGPSQVDGTLDNGIVAHEFGHGISNRLTGGPLAAGCLGNDEQMGEGWSDFFTLVTTVKETDTADQPRGIGTFVLNQPNNGQGIRRFPYSTDMGINPLTYDDIIGAGGADRAPHPVGEVWVAMLWDMYWALVDKYGYDADISNQNSGNALAVRLVMDGMRYQGCNPGFIDGRDGIIIADELHTGGENQCLIWDVFARRGLGFSADQGSSNNRNDGQEGFDTAPECLGRLDLVKVATPTIEAGEEILVNLRVGNHTGTMATNVVVTETLSPGTTILAGSSSVPFTQEGDVVTFEVGDMDVDETEQIIYRLTTDETQFSTRTFFDDVEDPDREFDWDFITVSGDEPWQVGEDLPYEGDRSWLIYTINDLDQGLYNFEPIQLPANDPIVRFFHNYDTEPGSDGGIFEISNDGGSTWTIVGSEIIRNGYRGKINYNAFTIPNLRAFWGDSQGWKETLIDLSAYAGQEIHMKFRYGTNEANDGRPIAWSIDNIEIMEPLFYNEEVCISADGVDSDCTFAEDGGTLVEAGMSTSTSTTDHGMELNIFPNPANTNVNLQFKNLQSSHLKVSVYAADGRLIRYIEQSNAGNAANLNVSTADFAPGLHLFKVQTDNDVLVKKIMIQH